MSGDDEGVAIDGDAGIPILPCASFPLGSFRLTSHPPEVVRSPVLIRRAATAQLYSSPAGWTEWGVLINRRSSLRALLHAQGLRGSGNWRRNNGLALQRRRAVNRWSRIG